MAQLAATATLAGLMVSGCGPTSAAPAPTVRQAEFEGITAGTLMLPNSPTSVISTSYTPGAGNIW